MGSALITKFTNPNPVPMKTIQGILVCLLSLGLLQCRENQKVEPIVSTPDLDSAFNRFEIKNFKTADGSHASGIKYAIVGDKKVEGVDLLYLQLATRKQNRDISSVNPTNFTSMLGIGEALNNQIKVPESERLFKFDSVLYKTFNTSSCKLPDKISNKIKKDRGFLPPKVKEFFFQGDDKNNTDFPKVVGKLQGKGIEYLLHNIDIKKKTNSFFSNDIYDYPLSFEGFELTDFIAARANTFFYTIDCQGYFNAALAVHGGLSFLSNIQGEASSNMNETSTTMIGYATVVNPFAAAYFNDVPGVKKLDPTKRIQILNKIVSIEGIEDNDVINYITAYNCLFTTKDSKNNLNGRVNLNVELHTPPINASVGSGMELTRKIEFSFFETYFSQDTYFSGRNSFSVKQVKDLITKLEKEVTDSKAQKPV